MYPALIFHSFNNNKNSDKFYDLDKKFINDNIIKPSSIHIIMRE